jgi:acetoacetate decarboxylase
MSRWIDGREGSAVSSYDPLKFWKFLNFGPGNTTYSCPGLKTLTVYCRGEGAQLRAFLDPTPFELADDRFAISIADFGNNSGKTYYDAAVIFAVRYGEHVGGSYYFEYEDKHSTVAGGRELWGYPKHFAKISLSESGDGIRGAATLEGDAVFEIGIAFDKSVNRAAWQDLRLFPHYQVRAVPQVNGAGFQSFDIVSRNTSKDYKLTERKVGRGEARLGSTVSFGGEKLRILEVLGAEYTVGDFASTHENGVPTIIASLI